MTDSEPRIVAAILRAPAPDLAEGERTHIGHQPIDFARAEAQHEAYAAALRGAGVDVTVLPPLGGLPDSCFVEDAAIILPECVVLTRPGADSRAEEPELLAPHLPPDRPVLRMARGRLDGGDVLWAGRTLYVGLSARTSPEGAETLAALIAPYGYRVETVPIGGALHLKTAMTLAGPETLLVNRLWASTPPRGFRTVEVGPSEPFGGNALRVNEALFVAWDKPVTAARLSAAGFSPKFLDISEFAKAEAGLTCLSLLVPEAA